MIIGVTGNIGSGKSSFIKIISRLLKINQVKSFVIDLDQLGHKQLTNNLELKHQLIEEFSKKILTKDQIDRKKLSQIVFSDKKALNRLNELIHPLIIKDLYRELNNNDGQIQLIDGALIFEMKIDQLCDLIVTIVTNYHHMVNRVKQRQNLAENEIIKRYKSQFDNKLKILNADYVIENNSSFSEFEKKIKDFYITKIETILKKKI